MLWKEINPVRDQTFLESIDGFHDFESGSKEEILLSRIMDPTNRLFTIEDNSVFDAMAQAAYESLHKGLCLTNSGQKIDRDKFMQQFREVAFQYGELEYLEFERDSDFRKKFGYQEPRDIYCLSVYAQDRRITLNKKNIYIWDEATLREAGVNVDAIPVLKHTPLPSPPCEPDESSFN